MSSSRADEPDALKQHWESVYTTRRPAEVSWYQAIPATSLSLIRASGATPATKIIDIGGGASTLADHLLAEGFNDITVLDLSPAAIEQSRQRLGSSANRIQWIATDITKWQPPMQYGIWHDRAVFHFLTRPADRDAYRSALTEALLPGASVIIATFALDGPERCSGLPVCRYSPETLATEFGPEFNLVESVIEKHHTPSGIIQSFIYCHFTR